MAPDKYNTDKKEEGEEKTQRTDGIDYRGESFFTGTLETNGKVACRLPSLKDPHKASCGSQLKNEHHSIASHIARMHKSGSSYLRGQKQDPTQTWSCSCGHYQSGTGNNWHSLLRHIRTAHGFTGDSDAIRAQGYATYDPATKSVITPAALAGQQQQEDKEAEAGFMNESLEKPIMDEPHPKPPYKDDEEDGGFGPTGGANGLIQAA